MKTKLQLLFLLFFSFISVSAPIEAGVFRKKPLSRITVYYLDGRKESGLLEAINDSTIFISSHNKISEIPVSLVQRIKLKKRTKGIFWGSILAGTVGGYLIGYILYEPPDPNNFNLFLGSRNDLGIIFGTFFGVLAIPVGFIANEHLKRCRVLKFDGNKERFTSYLSTIRIYYL